jgi:uncharacterized protein YjbJ (UPF0337 family)
MNRDRLKGNWLQFKGAVKQRWGKLTDDDIDVCEGQWDTLVGRIQERYGIAREAAERELNDWNVPVSEESDERRRKHA